VAAIPACQLRLGPVSGAFSIFSGYGGLERAGQLSLGLITNTSPSRGCHPSCEWSAQYFVKLDDLIKAHGLSIVYRWRLGIKDLDFEYELSRERV